MKIFSGSSNPKLAQRLAKELNLKLGKVEISRFSNNEARVRIKEKKVENQAIVVQSIVDSPDRFLIEFCLICDALRRSGVRRLIAVLPYLGYSKQDKVFRPGEPLSAKVIAKLIQVAEVDQLITFDLHNQAIVGFFDKPIKQLSAGSLFLDYFSQSKDKDTLVVAPDAGGVKASTNFAQQLGLKVAYIDKERDLNTGEVKIKGISKPVAGKKIFMIDDIVATGSTLIKAAQYLKKQGAKEIRVAITHHLYVSGVQLKIDRSSIDELLVTDTVQSPQPVSNYKKLKVVSVVPILAQEIRKD